MLTTCSIRSHCVENYSRNSKSMIKYRAMASPEVVEASTMKSRSHAAMATVMARIISGAGSVGGRVGVVERKRAVEEMTKLKKANLHKRRKLQRQALKSDSHSRFQHGDSDERESLSDSYSDDDDELLQAAAVCRSGASEVVRQCHKLPGDYGTEKETLLQSMATSGVVQLFNAVSKQQKVIEKKTKEAGNSERKRSKVLSSIDKGGFIDMLRSASSDSTSKKVQKPNSSGDAEPSWSALKEGYLKTPSAMMDWSDEDKQNPSLEEDNSSEDDDTLYR